MAIGSSIAVFFIIWWVTLFGVLPLGIRSQQESGEVVPGSDPGAPARTRLLRIVGINTLVASLVFAIFRFVVVPNF